MSIVLVEWFFNHGCISSGIWNSVQYYFGYYASDLQRKLVILQEFTLYIFVVVVFEILIFGYLADYFDRGDFNAA